MPATVNAMVAVPLPDVLINPPVKVALVTVPVLPGTVAHVPSPRRYLRKMGCLK